MPADDDRAVGPPGRGVGQQVLGGHLSMSIWSVRLSSQARRGRPLSPWANDALTTGMLRTGGSSVPPKRRRAGRRRHHVALVEDDDRAGAGGVALSALTEKLHEPRWMSAMLPAGKPAKSPVSQPLVDARSPTRLMSTAVTGADDRAATREVHREVVDAEGVGHGRVRRGPRQRRAGEVDPLVAELLPGGGVAGVVEEPLDVVDRGVVAGRAGLPGVVVGVGDGLELVEVRHHPADGDRVAAGPRCPW